MMGKLVGSYNITMRASYSQLQYSKGEMKMARKERKKTWESKREREKKSAQEMKCSHLRESRFSLSLFLSLASYGRIRCPEILSASSRMTILRVPNWKESWCILISHLLKQQLIKYTHHRHRAITLGFFFTTRAKKTTRQYSELVR